MFTNARFVAVESIEINPDLGNSERQFLWSSVRIIITFVMRHKLAVVYSFRYPIFDRIPSSSSREL
jgi:hypothetical protein